MISEKYELCVPFFDVDPMNIVWHGNYVKYLELARCHLLDKIGYGYTAMYASGYSFPIVDMHLKYLQAIRFEQDIVIEAILQEWDVRIKITYIIRDKKTNEKLTKAHTIQAAVHVESNTMKLACPPEFINKVSKFMES
jgi:acyl-CoA thioester hydrolase